MSRSSFRVVSLCLTLAGIAVVASPADSRASRPAVNPRVALVAHTRVSPRGELTAGHAVSGGGRGRIQAPARRDMPPPATRAASPQGCDCLLAGTDHVRRRTSHPRATLVAATTGERRIVCVTDAACDPAGVAPAALFHDAHAPPSPSSAVAGLLA